MGATVLPSFFSTARAVQYSDGIMRAIMPDGGLVPIPVREFSVRGSKSSHGDAYKLARGDAKTVKDVNTPNPQRVDGAFLPPDSDRMRLSFSMNVLSVTPERCACNDFEFIGKLDRFIGTFRKANGFDALAALIVWRIANASALWRNRYGEDKRVTVRSREGDTWVFDADAVSTVSPDAFAAPEDFVKHVAGALSGARGVLMLDVDIDVTIGHGQEVFPSQEMEMKKETNAKSKLLYRVPLNGVETAGLHPQKIGAAIRTFDVWHDDYAVAGPLAIEPLGYSHQFQKSFRTVQTGMDFYAHLSDIEAITQAIDVAGVDSRALFLTACLMRGGVFSASTNEEQKAADREAKAAKKREKVAPPSAPENAELFTPG